jgi:glutamate-1-semialdehyde aminotransferase
MTQNPHHNRFAQRYEESARLLERARAAVPGQAQTFSKAWTQYPLGAAPIFATRAEAGRVWDADGNAYIDWPMALGPLLLGHNHPRVVDAISRQLTNGIAFSLPTTAELDLAERLVSWFPYAERVRFGKNGSDATAGSVRAARAFTNRNRVLCCGYHGWQDWFIGTTTRSAGVPDAVAELTTPFPYNDLAALSDLLTRYAGDVACIIMEPMGVEEPAPGYLSSVRELADRHDVLLIFDECWTGFRIHRQGAYGAFGVAPDLACFGKAIGNGVPISVITGRADVMEIFDTVFFAFTFGGALLGICAAQAGLDVLEEEPVLETVAETGKQLMTGLTDLIEHHGLEQHIQLVGYPARHVMMFSGDGADGALIKSVFQQEALARGVLAAGWHAPSYAHLPDDVSETLTAYDQALDTISSGLADEALSDRLLGEMVQPVFRKP